ncbi:MAG: tRNA (adenosine(37)-N6)-dimethylallyltransferase MiaA, partial [Sedimentisphaerales bacterium]|nr:tRNA (adenosine(37)-N6)-dimethylallyltransferase MiaA [Sedimentisphaerales bacterium]
DSMKVYRRMDIGTAKPPQDIRSQIPYRLIDVVEPSESFSVARFLELAALAVKDIQSRNKPVVAVGGTALYIKSLLFGLFEGPGADEQIRDELKKLAQTDGLQSLYARLQKIDPDAAARISSNDERRIIRALEVYRLTGKPISTFQIQWNTSQDALHATHDWSIIGLRRDKTEEGKRINSRVKKMLDAGLVDEVKSLLAEIKPLSDQARCAIGYAEIIDCLSGKISLEDAVELIKKNTRKLAKQQRTWFKTFKNVRWLDLAPDETIDSVLTRAKEVLKNAN